MISRDVIFNEDELIHKTQLVEVTNSDLKSPEMLEFKVKQHDHGNNEEATGPEDGGDDSGNAQIPQQTTVTELSSWGSDYQLTRDRKKRQIKPTKRFGYADLIAFTLAATCDITDEGPKTFNEVLKSSYKREW